MPTLFRRANGIYYYVVTEPSGKRRWISTGEQSKQRALAKIQSILTTKEPPPKAGPSLDSFIAELLPYIRSTLSAGTAEIYSKTMKVFREYMGNLRLTDVNHRHVDQFTVRRLEKVSPVTVNIELRSLRAAFYIALRWEMITKNPFAKVRLIKVDEDFPHFLSKDELSRLVSTIKQEWLRFMVILAAMTGMRRGELLSLKWNNIDFSRQIIRVESQGTFRTKTGKKRVIPMNTAAENVLRKMQGRSESEYVFTTNGQQIEKHRVSRLFKQYVLELKLDPELTFHSLRHGFASWLVQDGTSLYQVQKLLGHSNIKVTEMYSHLVPEELHQTVNKIQFELN